jgi:hypothetical protein
MNLLGNGTSELIKARTLEEDQGVRSRTNPVFVFAREENKRYYIDAQNWIDALR